jgi:hypothetical protein
VNCPLRFISSPASPSIVPLAALAKASLENKTVDAQNVSTVAKAIRAVVRIFGPPRIEH